MNEAWQERSAAKPRWQNFRGQAGRPVLQLFVAVAAWTALELVDDFAVGAETVPGVLAPEGAIVGVLNGGVPLGLDKHALPSQLFAAVHADFGETWAFHIYAFCFAASPRARLTATLSRITL